MNGMPRAQGCAGAAPSCKINPQKMEQQNHAHPGKDNALEQTKRLRLHNPFHRRQRGNRPHLRIQKSPSATRAQPVSLVAHRRTGFRPANMNGGPATTFVFEVAALNRLAPSHISQLLMRLSLSGFPQWDSLMFPCKVSTHDNSALFLLAIAGALTHGCKFNFTG